MDGPGRVREAVGELLAGRDRVSDECARLLRQLETRCPGVLPNKPLEPGAVGPEIPLSHDEVQKLASVAAVTAAGLPIGTDAGQVVWSQGGNELLVMLAKVAVHVDHGIALIDIPASCDQQAEGHITVAFALGEDRRPAGMMAVTEDRPRGPRAVVDVWGESLTAFAWQVLLTVSTAVAGSAGDDVDGAPLIPVGLTATGDGLRILTMARHGFDRAD